MFGEWGEWEECTHSCGTGGTRSRHRECEIGDSSGTCPPGEVEFCPDHLDCPLTAPTPTATTTFSTFNWDGPTEDDYSDIQPLVDSVLSSEVLENI